MQTNRTFNTNFNKNNIRIFGGYDTLIGAPNFIHLNNSDENLVSILRESLVKLEKLGIRFYRNKINELVFDLESNTIKSANTKFIEIKAKDLPIIYENGYITFGFTREEYDKYTFNSLDYYNIQGWGIRIPKKLDILSDYLVNTDKLKLGINIFNSSTVKESIKIERLPYVEIFEEDLAY